MAGITLDTRLANDCVLMGNLENSALLLHKNALFPWFILVPDASETELYKLETSQQQQLLESINVISTFIESQFKIDKLNVASIGNIVSQLHVHIIGRHRNDACWPAVVWGFEKSKSYKDASVKTIQNNLIAALGSDFSACNL